MNEYFDPPDYIIDFLSQAEGEPRLKAKLCMGGAWELGWGCTFHTDDRPVRAGETCDYDYAVALRKHALKKFADLVRSRLTIQVKEHQFWALVCLAYNIGDGSFTETNCTVLRETNAGNFANAVHAFERWTGASKDGPDRSNPNDDPADFIAPDGSPCGYFRRLRGLLRRELGQACIYDGCHPEQATYQRGDDDPIAMTVCARDKRHWNPDKWRWEDLVLSYTPYKQVQSVARMYPLPPLELTLTQKAEPAQSVAPASAGQPVDVPSPPPAAPASTKPAAPVSGPAAGPVAAPKAPQAPTPLPVPSQKPVDTKPPEKPVVIAPQPVNPNALPTNADTAKNMADSTRMVGMVLVAIGSVIQVVTLRLGIGTAIGAVFFDLTRDPVVITLTVTAIVGALGWLTKKNGKKTFAKGADQMVQTLY